MREVLRKEQIKVYGVSDRGTRVPTGFWNYLTMTISYEFTGSSPTEFTGSVGIPQRRHQIQVIAFASWSLEALEIWRV